MRVKQFFPLLTFVIETLDRRKEDAKGIETPSQLFNEHAWVLACLLEQSLVQNLWIQSLSISSRNNLAYQSEMSISGFCGNDYCLAQPIHCIYDSFFLLFKKTINFRHINTYMNSSKNETEVMISVRWMETLFFVAPICSMNKLKVKQFVFLMR